MSDLILPKALYQGYQLANYAKTAKRIYTMATSRGTKRTRSGRRIKGRRTKKRFARRIKGKTATGRPLTFQRDVRTLGRSKPTRILRRAAKKRNRLTKALAMLSQPQWFYRQFNGLLGPGGAANQSVATAISLCPAWGSVGTDDDIRALITDMMVGISGGPAVSQNNMKLYLQSAQMKILLTNVAAGVAKLDVYEYVCRKDFAESGVLVAYNFMSAAKWGGTTVAPVAGIAPIGVTPYMSQTFVTHFKILSKQSIYVQPDQSTELNMSMGARVIDGSQFADATSNQLCALAGITRGFLIVASGDCAPLDGGTNVPQLGLNVQRTYNCKKDWNIFPATTQKIF